MCLVNTGDPILLYGVIRQLPYFLHRFAAWGVQASLGSEEEHQTWLGAGGWWVVKGGSNPKISNC